MVNRNGRIIATPFRSRSISALRRTNKEIRDMSARVRLNKRNIIVRDTINAKGLPKIDRPGAIE